MRKKPGARSAMEELLSKGNEAQLTGTGTGAAAGVLKYPAERIRVHNRPSDRGFRAMPPASEAVVRRPAAPAGNAVRTAKGAPSGAKAPVKAPAKAPGKAAGAAAPRGVRQAVQAQDKPRTKFADIKKNTRSIKKYVYAAASVAAVAVLCVAAVLLLAGRSEAKPDVYLGAVPTDTAANFNSLPVGATGSESDSETAENGRYTVTFSPFGEEQVSCITGGKTVGELLGILGITPGEDQILRANTEDIIGGNTEIAIDKLTYGTVTVDEAIAFETQYVDVSTIPRGTTKVSRAGVNGVKKTEYAVTYVNGVESERVQSAEYVAAKPTAQIVQRGVGGTVSIGGKSYSYSYYIDCRTTVYTGGGTTATGLPATEAVIAVDPRVIPLGSKVYVADSYCYVGIRTAADTGGSIKGNIIDIYMDESNPYLKGYGRRSARVYILD